MLINFSVFSDPSKLIRTFLLINFQGIKDGLEYFSLRNEVFFHQMNVLHIFCSLDFKNHSDPHLSRPFIRFRTISEPPLYYDPLFIRNPRVLSKQVLMLIIMQIFAFKVTFTNNDNTVFKKYYVKILRKKY